jgi:hypothetical protein
VEKAPHPSPRWGILSDVIRGGGCKKWNERKGRGKMNLKDRGRMRGKNTVLVLRVKYFNP